MTKQNPRVLLIIPPEKLRNPTPQLGSLYVAAALKQRNILCRVLDCRVEDIDFSNLRKYKLTNRAITYPIQWNVLKEKIKQFQPEIVGITAQTPQIKNGAKIAGIVKGCCRDVTVLVGGVHASTLPRKTLEEFPEFDILFKGEVDNTIADFVEMWSSGNNQWKTLPGVVYREKGMVIESPIFPKVEDMDSLPSPARELAPMMQYQKFLEFSKFLGKNVHAAGIMMTSRGCPSHCTFCTSPNIRGRIFRAQSPKRVIEEMEFSKRNYGVSFFLFWDDIFTVDKKRVHEICDHIISHNWNISFMCFSKVGQIDVPLMQKMKKAGCTIINYGIETGSESVMRSIKKGITLENTLKTIQQTVESGITPSANFMLGHPADTPETIKETMRYITKLVHVGLENIGINITNPYPGTKMFEDEYANINTFDWDAFAHSGYGTDIQDTVSVYAPKNMTRPQLTKMQKEAYHIFNRTLLMRKVFKGNFKYFFKAVRQKFSTTLNFIFLKFTTSSTDSA